MKKHRLRRTVPVIISLLLGVYLLAAYLAVPALWAHYEHQPGLAQLPMVTTTRQGIPGDPINVGLVGSATEIATAMAAAKWYSADPVTTRTSFEIASSVTFHRAYVHAPVSPLFYAGRRQDLAFEKPAGKDAAQRHHVRFWKVLDKGEEGRPVWLGAATFDQGVGPTIGAKNGGGDYYYSDGEIKFAVIAPQAALQNSPPVELLPSAAVFYKDMIWAAATGQRGR